MAKKNYMATFDSFLDNKVSHLDRNNKIAICAAAVLIPVALFYFFFFSPKSKDITALEGRVSSLEQELQIVKIKAAKLDQQKAKMAELEIKFKEASEVIPDTKEIPNLLTNISSEGTNSGLEITSFVPGADVPKEFYAEIPVKLSVVGTYHNLGHFLDTVSKLPRIVNVSNINLSSPRFVEGEMLLNSNVQLVTYKFIEPKEAE